MQNLHNRARIVSVMRSDRSGYRFAGATVGIAVALILAVAWPGRKSLPSVKDGETGNAQY